MVQVKARIQRPTVVIGAGIVGISTAYALAARGVPVVLLERFTIGHDRGSSHGESRIIRYSYSDFMYASLMRDAFQAWEGLESAVGLPLYLRTGGLSFGPDHIPYVNSIAANLQSLQVPCCYLTPARVSKLYPSLKMPEDYQCLFEPSAGVLMAEKVLHTLLDFTSERYADLFTLRENTIVQGLDFDGANPMVLLADGERLEAERVVIAAGAWVRQLLPAETRNMHVSRQCVFYLRPQTLDSFRPGRWPVLIFKGNDDQDLFYSLPALGAQGVKVAQHSGAVCQPDSVSRDVGPADWQPVSDFLRKHLPSWAEAEQTQRTTCLYTMTPDEDFRVGIIEQHERVVMASPCSGHGFKFGPLVGRLVADICEKGRPHLDINRWQPMGQPLARRVSL